MTRGPAAGHGDRPTGCESVGEVLIEEEGVRGGAVVLVCAGGASTFCVVQRAPPAAPRAPSHTSHAEHQ